MEARTMDYGAIGWAINAVRLGHKVRRSGWPGNFYIALDNGVIQLCADDVTGQPLKDPEHYLSNQRDLLANDWLLVDPTLPGEYHS
jgi:hypothetical protein